MPDKMFSGFSAISSKQWKQKIQYELSGADYNETLVWESPEGIKVKPFYHGDEDVAGSLSAPRDEPFKICQDIFVFDVAKSAVRALDTINRGAESIRFIIEDGTTDIELLLSNLQVDGLTLYFELGFLSSEYKSKIQQALQGRNVQFFIDVDPIGRLAKDGNWFVSQPVDNFEVLEKNLHRLNSISVNGCLYHNAGANMAQQLAYTLAHATEYFNRFSNVKQPVLIKMSVGSNYFFEIAKLRAMRILFDAVASEFGHTAGCHLYVTPGRRNKTLYDYNVNMLRTTSECMSAILGGADAVANLPYDALYHKSNEFAERIARNQLLILKHESYFDKVGNAADGSYYIELLTNQLAEKALIIFKEIEAAGGFLEQLKSGVIQRKIAESAEKEQQLFDSGKEILLGTNKQINKNDRMQHELELFPFVKVKSKKTLVTPIIEKRLAEKVEQERLALEK
jgi:methylmalonyl-CoA mutase